MKWDTIWKALIPSVQSAVYALLAMLIGAGGTYAVNREKPAVAPPVAQQTALARTPQSDQTKLQLQGIQNGIDELRDTLRDMRRDMTPRTAAKSK
jgi:hypothetical protein